MTALGMTAMYEGRLIWSQTFCEQNSKCVMSNVYD
jgi:hypothetical protein